jgi:LmbE family N-acetylglucosaminyl deacetylase
LRTRFRLVVLFVFICFGVALAQPSKPIPYSQPLPQDQGRPGLTQQLRKLRTTARLLQVTAHPDDEDGGMLTLEARGEGVDAILMSLTRGEGGQNRMGSGLFDALGSLRTLELLAADRYYGVEQRFSHAADFGFSKSPQETFDKWGGRDTALADIVRVIRTFRPDVVVSRFSGTAADGHGHHQAAALLTREAFRAAADPTRFPDQIEHGLAPWQAKKLYMGVLVRDATDYSIAIDKGAVDPALGMSYQQFAMQGLRHQLSQGAGQWNLPPGPYISRYKLADATFDRKLAEGDHEKSFFDGIDTTLPGLAARLGADEQSVPWLRAELLAAESEFANAQGASDGPEASDRRGAIGPLLRGAKRLEDVIVKLRGSELPGASREDLIVRLERKVEEAYEAARLAGGRQLEAVIERKDAPETSGIIVPGETFTLAVHVEQRDVDGAAPRMEKLKQVRVLPNNGGSWKIERLAGNQGDDTVRFRITVPSDAEYTRPYFSRKNPESDGVYRVSDQRFATLPLMPPPLRVEAEYEVGGATGRLTAIPVANFVSNGDKLSRPLAVLPAVSVVVDPPTRVLPMSLQSQVEVHVQVHVNSDAIRDAELQLRVPDGWQVEPLHQPVTIEGRGAEHTYKFFLLRVGGKAGLSEIRAFLDESP